MMNKVEQLLEKMRNKSPKIINSESLIHENLISGPPPEPTPDPWVNFTMKFIADPAEAESIVEAFAEDNIIGIDIETMKLPGFKSHPQAGLNAHLSKIRLLQLCQTPEIVYVFDVLKTGWDPLRSVFTKSLVAHNAIFEMSHLYHAGIEIAHLDCTMLMHNALYGGTLSLKNLTSKMLGITISKEEQVSDWSESKLSRSQIIYAAKDAWLVKKLHPLLASKLEITQKVSLYKLLQAAQFPVMKMQYNGCHFDASAHHLLTEQNKNDLKKAEDRLREAVGSGVNLSSGKQLSNHYKKILDTKTLDSWKKTTKSQDLSLNSETVKQYSHIEAVAPLADFKVLKTKVEKFGDNLINDINPVTGRIHAKYMIAGATTGRFTCSKPNLQQVPKEKDYRKLFNAPVGRKIVVADYSQVELRILAMLSKDPTMLQAYKNGEDLHRLTASSMAGVPYDDVTDEQRRAAKPVNFGIIYGMGAKGLTSYAWASYGVLMTKKEAEANITAFFKKYPGVKRWGDVNYKKARSYKRVETKLGRVIKVDNEYTQSKNYPVQGSAGEVMLAALIELDREIAESGLDIKLVNNIHDEVVLEVAEAEAQQAARVLEKAMVNGMLYVFPEAETVGLVEASVRDSWAKEEK